MQINKRENMNVLCLQGFGLAPKWVAHVRQLGAFSSFESEGTTKHLMTGPSGNREFCFPSTSMFPSASPLETLGVSGRKKLTVSLEASQ